MKPSVDAERPQTPAPNSCIARLLEIVVFPAPQYLPAPSSLSTRPEPSWAALPLTGTSPQSVVLHVLWAVGEPSWAPATAAERLLEHVDDALVLRRARALLRVVTRHRIDPSHARAFATISMALRLLESHVPVSAHNAQMHGIDGTRR